MYHDESVYDYRNGKLDRSAAYTYALDGISGLLQKYPSIEVVLDVHRDGVSDGTRLVTEIDGTETAKIMFFNGTSMSRTAPSSIFRIQISRKTWRSASRCSFWLLENIRDLRERSI